jgi:chromate transporter
MNVFVSLFLEFFKIGAFAIGGGLAALPFLYDIADRYSWFTRTMLIDMIAVAESTPGPIGVNAATFAGFRAAGIIGGIMATFSLVLPSFIIVLGFSEFLSCNSGNKHVLGAFYALRPAATGMIAAAGLSVARMALLTDTAITNTFDFFSAINIQGVLLFVLLYVLFVRFKKHPIFYIVGAALVGIIFKM